jgi:CDP-glycerol glycerophosphotransferase
MPRTSIVVPHLGQATDSCPAARSARHVSDAEVVADAPSAAGRYLIFLPADDVIVPNGLAALADALDSSGSDLALATGTGPGTLAALSDPATGVSVEQRPELVELADPAAVLWRRSCWAGLDLHWPDSELEQRVLLARAILTAGGVDVVPEPVHASTRPAGLTTARRRLRTQDTAPLADHLDALHEVARSIASPDVRRHWEATVVEPALRSALSHLGMAEPEVRDRLVERVADILEEADPQLMSRAKAVHRLEYHLARRRLVPQLLEVVKADRFGELSLRRAVRRGRTFYGDYPFRTDRALSVPRDVYRLEREMTLRAQVDGVRFDADTLHIEGHAYVPFLDADGPRAGRLRLKLVTAGRRPVHLPVERTQRPDVAASAREAAYDYGWAGFRTSVPVGALRGRSGWSRGVWRLEATLSRRGVRRTRVVTATSPGRPRNPPVLETDGVRIVPVSGRGAFAVEVDLLPVIATSVRAAEGKVVLQGQVRRRVDGDVARLLVTRASGSVALEVGPVPLVVEDGGRTFTACLPLADLQRAAAGEPNAAGDWTVRLDLPGVAKPVPVRAADAMVATSVVERGVAVRVHRTRHGRVALTCGPQLPVVEQARWSGDVLELSGPWPGDGTTLALVTQDGTREHALAPEVAGGGFRLALRPGAVTTLAGTLPLTQGGWLPVVRRPGDPATRSLSADPDLLTTLPLRHDIGAKAFELSEEDGALVLLVGPDLRDDERGAPNQLRMQQAFPRLVARGLRDEVLFESYESRAYADNARAILEELSRRESGLHCRWVVVDGQAALPDGVEPVRRASREHYEALARSRYVVVPNYRPLESWLETPPDQVVAQTWHGAPYKKIGLDNVRGQTFSARNYSEMLRREAARWDYLLSPNPPSTPLLRQAFAYEGEVLETGYPRTDLFHSPDRDLVAEAVRRRLGLPEGKRVVLYAPTMRDDHSYGRNRFSLDLRLDLDVARAELSDDHVLLVRRHAKVADDVRSADGMFARDMSLYPDVNELLLVTDVLVTDYSSLLFDFASTRRPMLFFTYDLEDYRDRLRGLYFDPARMPGPHLRTSDEVIAAVRDVETHAAEHAASYRRFVDDFCPWDDGKAAQRFVDRVFAPHV